MAQRGFAVLGSGLFLALVTPACAQEVLRVPLTVDIGSFDPDNGFEIGAMSAINNVYEGLVEYAPGTTDIVGLLADTWTISDDGLTYEFDLVDNVRFHDGTPMDAEAVIRSLERRRDGGLILSYFSANVDTVEAADDDTVVVTLKQPQPSFLDGLASAWGVKIISPQALDEHEGGDQATSWLNENAVGTGPFTLAEFNRGQDYVLARNPDYWGEAPFFDEIRMPLVPDIGQQILQLQAGEIDVVPDFYPVAQLASLPAGLAVSTAPSLTQFELFLKPGTALDDPALRQAALAAINPALWMTEIFGDHAELSKSLYQNAMLDPALPVQFPSDLEAARAAVAAHEPVALVIGVPSEIASYARTAEVLAAQLGTIGIEASVAIMPIGASYAMKGDANAPDMLLTIANPDAAHPESQAKTYFTTEGVLNFYGRSLPEADALVQEAGLVTDIPARDALYEEAGHMYFDAGQAIPLVDVDDVLVHIEGLTDLGLRPAFPQGNIDYGMVRWAD